jgi:hypothetical protein
VYTLNTYILPTTYYLLQGKRLRDLEEQRYRLEKDLQGRIENLVELQLKVDMQAR